VYPALGAGTASRERNSATSLRDAWRRKVILKQPHAIVHLVRLFSPAFSGDFLAR
jgi:hypothetical protein